MANNWPSWISRKRAMWGLADTLEEQARMVREPLLDRDLKWTTAAICLPVPLNTKKPLGLGVKLRPDTEEFVEIGLELG